MYRKVIISALLLFTMSVIHSQTNDQTIKVTLSGFVKTDYMFDTRQTVNAREGHFLLFPAPEVLDPNGEDKNAAANFNTLAIQSRLRVSMSGPEILGAQSTAFIEGAFFGHSNSDVNGFRLRHAVVKLDWENNSLLAGQYWHPMFIEEVYPGVASFNTGVPFMPFSRNPQIKVSQTLGNLKASFTLASQRDFSSTGPNGVSSEYLRNSALPIMNLTLRYYGSSIVFGGGVNFTSIQPELNTAMDYKSTEKVNSTSFVGFAKYSKEDFTFKVFGTYGENLYDLLMIGGYGVSSVDETTGICTYTKLRTVSAWTEFVYGKDIKGGLFAGYTKNLGSQQDVVGDIFGRGSNINSAFRISPRAEFNFSPVKLSVELEYTSAAYGIPNTKYEVENSTSVSNFRILTAVYYFFK